MAAPLRRTIGILAALALAVSAPAVAAGPEEAVSLPGIKAVFVAPDASADVQQVATRLNYMVVKLYKASSTVRKEMPGPQAKGIVVGREAALASGAVIAPELEAVKHDGFVIKAAGDRIAVAGFKPQGTIYGAYALMRRMGLEMYPWHGGSGGITGPHALEVFRPMDRGLLPAMHLADKPWIVHRDSYGRHDDGRWGGTFRIHALSDPTTAANQDLFGRNRKPGYTKLKLVGKAADADGIGWDHTAAYLVPRDLYYADHPEYYAMDRSGKRIAPAAHPGMGICSSNADVRRISAERMLEWMGLQKMRRFFVTTEADGVYCWCPQCRALDPQPDYITDRSLTWANYVADHVRDRHPEKLLPFWAYLASAKPPVSVKPAPNVVIGYAAWLWNSRASSAVDFAHPANITCMEEFMGWSLVAPDRMGAYDYPGDGIAAAARRFKFYARNGVRFIYTNAASGGARQHYLLNRLMWDPFLDAEALDRDFSEVSYGPAASLITEYFRQEEAMLASRSIDGLRKYAAEDPAFAVKARQILDLIAKVASSAEPEVRARILQFIVEARYGIVRALHPSKGLSILARANRNEFENDLRQFFEAHRQLAAEAAAQKLYFDSARDLGIKLSPIGMSARATGTSSAPAHTTATDKAPPAKDKLFDESIAEVGDIVQKELGKTFVLEPPASTTLRFDSADEAKLWRIASSRTDLLTPVESATIVVPDGVQLRGARLKAALAQLPVLPRGNIRIHVGEFHAERAVKPELDARGMPYLAIRLHSTRDVPATLAFDLGADRIKADVDLHAGEQIFRIDLRNFAVDYGKWDGKLRGVSVQIWPQDNNWPYPQTNDTEVTLLDLEATNRAADPACLPPRPAAIWMTHFRANRPHDVHRSLGDTAGAYAALMKQHGETHKPVIAIGGRGESFRTWTPHRLVSPVFAILTDDTPGAKLAAGMMQRYLSTLHGVKLPINPRGMAITAHTGNCIILGRNAALSARRVTEAELAHVGAEGFVIRSRDGRIVIAGADDAGTQHGAARYLMDLTAVFPVPGVCEVVQDRRGRFLHELVLFDWPWFKNRDVPGGPLLMAQGEVRTWPKPEPADAAAIEAVTRLAETIKDCARAGKTEVSPSVLRDARVSSLTAYVVAGMLWDPMANTSALIRQYQDAAAGARTP